MGGHPLSDEEEEVLIEEEEEEPQGRRAAVPAPAPVRRRGNRAGRDRQQRWQYRDWRTQCGSIERFVYPYVGKVNLWYPYWWQAPQRAQNVIQDFDFNHALHNVDTTFWALRDVIPEVRDACRRFGLHHSTHEIVGRRVSVKRAAVPAPRTAAKAPSKKLKGSPKRPEVRASTVSPHPGRRSGVATGTP